MPARPFQLVIDSGNRDEPRTRYFSTLKAAMYAADQLPAKWWPHLWISEILPDGGRFVHVRNGRQIVERDPA